MARSLASIMSNISTMSDDAANVDLFAMLYAEFGAGKTVTTMALAQSLKGDGDILFCDSSDGWVSLQEFPDLMEGVDRFRATDPADLIPIANGLTSKKLKSRRKRPYTVVVLDEASSIFDTLLEQSIRDKYGLDPDDPFPEIEGREYGPATMALESLMRKFHDAPDVHVLVTAHAREVAESGGIKELRPSFPPKAYAVMMRKLHVCAALSARKQRDPKTKKLNYVRTVQLLPSANTAAKSRIPGSPMSCDPVEFIELVTGWVASDTFASEALGEAPKTEIAEDPYVEPEEAPVDDEEGEEEFTEEMLREELKGMGIAEIREFAEKDYDIDLTGVKKADAIERLVDHFFGEEE